MTTLTIVRHGQTDWNTECRFQGSSDMELNDTGIAQAEALARTLEEHTYDILVSSPLKRAMTTARILGDHLGLEPLSDERFRERHLGLFEGLTAAEARVQFPREWQNNCTRQLFLAPPEGESVLQVGFRVQEGLCSLYENYQNKKILLVCHGFVSRTITGLLNHLPDEDFYEFRLGNCDSMSFIL